MSGMLSRGYSRPCNLELRTLSKRRVICDRTAWMAVAVSGL